MIFSLDVIHGYKTIFPVPIAEASSWDPAAVTSDGAISADEAAADGIMWPFNPMVDVSRDPRWGRVVEGSGGGPVPWISDGGGEGGRLSGRRLQRAGQDGRDREAFPAYGAPVAGREYNTVDMSEQQLLNDYLPPCKAAIDAGAATVISAFNSLDGVPASANPYLLSTIFRKERGSAARW